MHHPQRSRRLRPLSRQFTYRCRNRNGPSAKAGGPPRTPPSEPAEGRRLVLTVLAGCLIVFVAACGPDETRPPPLPQRLAPPDTTALTPRIRSEGGAVLLELTGWVNARVTEEFVAAGLEPLPGYDSVESLDSMGQNVIGGTVTEETLDRILTLPYIVEVRPADVER